MSAHTSIQSVGMRFVQTWNAHDMDEFALLFREDAEFVNVYGSSYVGRARIRDEHTSIHATVFRDSQLSASEMRIKELTDTIAKDPGTRPIGSRI
jgi:uncharacterized protein (TIGR02246 family)